MSSTDDFLERESKKDLNIYIYKRPKEIKRKITKKAQKDKKEKLKVKSLKR